MDGIRIRPARFEDAEKLAEIEKECFSIPLTEEQLLAQIRDEKTVVLSAEDQNGNLVGYAGFY